MLVSLLGERSRTFISSDISRPVALVNDSSYLPEGGELVAPSYNYPTPCTCPRRPAATPKHQFVLPSLR